MKNANTVTKSLSTVSYNMVTSKHANSASEEIWKNSKMEGKKNQECTNTLVLSVKLSNFGPNYNNFLSAIAVR